MRKEIFYTGGYFHVYNRGVDRRSIFNDDIDRFRFIKNTSRLAEKNFVRILCYCLMSNHFHFLLRQQIEDGISKFMHGLGTGYTKYFNIRTARSGSLFEGPFKAKEVNSDGYLFSLSRYIHLNPINAIEPGWKTRGLRDIDQIKNYLRTYPWSSYQDYLDLWTTRFIDKDVLPEYFTGPNDYENFVSSWSAGQVLF